MRCRVFICIPFFPPVVTTKNVSRLPDIPSRGKSSGDRIRFRRYSGFWGSDPFQSRQQRCLSYVNELVAGLARSSRRSRSCSSVSLESVVVQESRARPGEGAGHGLGPKGATRESTGATRSLPRGAGRNPAGSAALGEGRITEGPSRTRRVTVLGL